MKAWRKAQGKEPNEFQKDWEHKSIFDPVLTELLYTWFSPKGAKILDPFAGGSVRGIIAGVLGRPYLGIDISADQIFENQKQAESFEFDSAPKWKKGDAVKLYQSGVRGKFDMILTCPPYGDLERYSDDPDDLSNMPYDVFLGCFRQAVKAATDRLNEDRFAAIVVGDFRDKNGIYRGFVSDTISAFKDAGLHLYNEAILVTQAASLPVRVRGMFTAGQKLGKTHQNVLVLVKGNPKAATEFAGSVEPYRFDA